MSKQSISIIGAGLGGLACARTLAARGITANIYDRHTGTARHDYSITLVAATYKPLLRILKIDHETFVQRVAVDAPFGGTGRVKALLGGRTEKSSKAIRVNRQELETLLQDGVNVKWDHTLVGLEARSDQHILSFENGRSETTNTLAAFDGVHSSTRNILFPERGHLTVLPYAVVFGRRRVARDVFESAYLPFMSGHAAVEARVHDTVLQISIDRVGDDLVGLSWMYSRPARQSNDPLYMPDRPLGASSDIPADFFDELSALKDLPEPFATCFDPSAVRSDRMHSFLMRTSDVDETELREAAARGVILAGDASHTEPIRGGYGANHAIDSGMSIADRLLAGRDVTSTASWWDEVYNDKTADVRRSRELLNSMHER